MKSFCVACLLVFGQALAFAETPGDESAPDTTMNNQRLQRLIEQLADDIEGRPGYWRFELEGFQASVITDEEADRMRIIVPVARMEDVDADRLYRVLQANFDSALDARYSIARGVLWSAFLHPLASLSDHRFIGGLAQTVNLAATYGTSYSSGALVFSQGDSQEQQDRHYQQIIERENSI